MGEFTFTSNNFYKNLLNFLEKWSDLLYNLLIIQRSKDLCLEEEE